MGVFVVSGIYSQSADGYLVCGGVQMDVWCGEECRWMSGGGRSADGCLVWGGVRMDVWWGEECRWMSGVGRSENGCQWYESTDKYLLFSEITAHSRNTCFLLCACVVNVLP